MHELHYSSTLLFFLHHLATREHSVAPPGGTILFLRTALSHFLPRSGLVFFFERASLRDLGHTLCIGHQYSPCPSVDSKSQVVLVIDVNGSHHVNVQFCTCTEDTPWVKEYCQLLWIGWYPASFGKPKTAFTFNVLDTYHKLVLQGKLSLYDFLLSILQKTDNCGQSRPIISHLFMLVLSHRCLHSSSTGTTTCRNALANGDI